MIRRIVMVAAAAATLILVPSAAMAFNAPMTYNAPGYTSTVSDSTPAIGQPVKVTIRGVPHERITLTITSNRASTNTNVIEVAGSSSRVKAQTKQLNANGVGTWTVRFTAAGVYTLTMTNVAGVVVSTQTVEVLGVSANAPIPAAVGALPRTGFDPKGLLVGGGLLLFAGAGAVVAAKRRRSSQVSA